MKRLLAGLTVPVLALSLLSGCGGDEETSADDTTSSSPSPSTPSDEPSDEPSDGSASVDPDAPGAGTKYCDLLGTDFASLFANIQGPEDVNKAVGMIEQIADEAPSEVEDQWGLMSTAFQRSAGPLKEYAELQRKAAEGKISKEKVQKDTARLMQKMQEFDKPENAKAGDAVSKHASEYCGIKLG